MRQQKAAEEQIRRSNRERGLKNVMAHELEPWKIAARFSDIAFGRVQSYGSLRHQYGIEQMRRPAGTTAEIDRQPGRMTAAGIACSFQQPACFRFVDFRKAAQTAACLFIVPKGVKFEVEAAGDVAYLCYYKQ